MVTQVRRNTAIQLLPEKKAEIRVTDIFVQTLN